MKELELSDGTLVHVRSVPPHARAAVYHAEKAPPFPRREIQSVAGGTETHDELEKSEAALAWREEMAAYQVRQRERSVDFNLDYGLVDWQIHGVGPWQADPPEDWVFPKTLLKYGVVPGDDARVDYIKYDLIKTSADRDMIDDELIGELEPITEEEVERTTTPFV